MHARTHTHTCIFQLLRTSKAFLASKTKLVQDKAAEVGALQSRIAALEERDALRGRILDDMLSRTASVMANRSPSPTHASSPMLARPLSADASPEFVSPVEASPGPYTGGMGSPMHAWQNSEGVSSVAVNSGSGGTGASTRVARRSSVTVCMLAGWCVERNI